jgi:hypothetical protein
MTTAIADTILMVGDMITTTTTTTVLETMNDLSTIIITVIITTGGGLDLDLLSVILMGILERA